MRYLLLAIAGFTFFTGCDPSSKLGKSKSFDSRHLLLRDEGLSQLSYVDMSNPSANWYIPVPAGRDIQLSGNGNVFIGTGQGFEEREIITGRKMYELKSFPGTISARKLKNGNVLLAGLDWQNKKGISLVETDVNGNVQRIINYPEFNYVRLVRETSSGTFMVTANDMIFEGDTNGSVLWKAKIVSAKQPHAWQAIKLSNNKVVVSGGYSGNIQVFAADANLEKTIGGPAEVNPDFYGGFQILSNGHYVVTNWQGHGAGHGGSGIQLLEYAQDGKLAWSWKQDSTKYSSLQGVIILDGLDLKLAHTENDRGVLASFK